MSIQSNFPAVKPSLLLDFANTKQLDNRITFTRSTPAVYYDGKTTAMAEQNLLTYSDDLSDSSWTVANATKVTGITAPDGTATAVKFVEGVTVGGTHFFYKSSGHPNISSKTVVFSIYAKAVERSWISVNTYDSGYIQNYFDIGTGALGTIALGNTANIVSVGGGWYRIDIKRSFGAGLTGIAEITLATGDGVNAYNGNGTSGVYLWHPQIEQRSTATAYTVTTTQPITNYIPVLLSAGGNQARFDYTPTTGESLGLLIEEQRTNLALQSADFSTTWSSANQVSITSNTIVAPDGTLTGDKLIADATSNVHFVVQNTGSISAPWTFSCYAKAGEYSRVGFSYSNTGYVFFNLTTGVQEGTVGGGITSTSITSVGNGWYRISFTSTSTASGGNIGIYLFNTTYTSGIPTFTGNGFSGAYIWGAQAEAGSFASSYIATTSASATRTADRAFMTGANFSNWFNAGQGSFIVNAARAAIQDSTGAGGYGRILGNDTGTNSFLEYSPTTNIVYVSGASAYSFTVPNLNTSASVFNNMAVSYGSTGISVTANNGSVQVNASARMANSNGLYILATGNGAYSTSGLVKRIAYYPIQVTSTNLQALTS
jgi:hypothetical protein